MLAISLIDLIDENQQKDQNWMYQSIQFNGNQILCPMCNIWHDNHSECQRND